MNEKKTEIRQPGTADTATAPELESAAAQAMQPPKPPGAKPSALVAPSRVPSEAFVRRMSDLARRAFPSAPPVSSTSPPPKNDHVDLLAIELWASGNLPDRGFFGRWQSHVETCEQCSSRLKTAEARRRAG